jgi:hypothetical protein
MAGRRTVDALPSSGQAFEIGTLCGSVSASLDAFTFSTPSRAQVAAENEKALDAR